MTAERYSIAVPAGWVHVPGRVDPDDAARAATEAARADGAADGPWVAEAETALADVLRADVPGLVLDSYLPAGGFGGSGVSASVTVAAVSLDDAPSDDVDEVLLAQLLQHGGVMTAIAGVPAVRWWDRSTPAPDAVPAGARVLATRVLLGRIPDRNDLLLTVRLVVVSRDPEQTDPDDVAGERAVVEALGVLFDAMCASIEWRDGAGEHVLVGSGHDIDEEPTA